MGPLWPQGGATGRGERGLTPPNKIPPKCFFHEIFPEGVTAAAGRQGELKGGGKEGWGREGSTNPQ